jgi:serine/threonine protein kinase
MATVYLGRLVSNEGFKRWVAVKRIHEHLSDDQQFRDMFLDEARLVAKLNHPNVIHLNDVGLDDGRPYLVMEYVDGATLAQLLRQRVKRKRRLPLSMAARIVACACEGLHHAHELRTPEGKLVGLVHRDVSPHNVMVSYEGAVILTDFGIAKAIGRSTKTRTGLLKGKPAYMSPEQARAQRLDRRSDIFSIGVVLYEATLSRRLFHSESELETLQLLTSGKIDPPCQVDPDYPAALETIVMRALSMNPDERFQTARDMQTAIERYLAGLGQPIGSPELAELMAGTFPDRKVDSVDLVTSGGNPSNTPYDLPLLVEDSTSLSLPPRKFDRRLADQAPKRSGARSFLVAIGFLGACLLSVAAGAMLRSQWTASDADSEAELLTRGAPRTQGKTKGNDNGFLLWQSTSPPSGPSSAGSPVATDQTDANPIADKADAMPMATKADATVPETVAPPNAAAPAGSNTTRKSTSARARTNRRSNEQSERQSNWRKQNNRGTTAPPGAISVIANPWCEVYVGGRRLGRTPIMRAELPPGRHVLRLMPRGRGPAKRRVVTVRSGELTPVSVGLSP